jgi:hypothetical protein
MPILADAGIPMISLEMPVMLGALIPVIIIESLLIKRALPLTYQKAFAGIAMANIFSTIAGAPLAWLLMLAIELGVGFPASAAAKHWHFVAKIFDSPLLLPLCAAWMGPVRPHSFWEIPFELGILLIPTFFISVWIERRICKQAWEGVPVIAVNRAVFNVNLASYGLLFFLACGWVVYELLMRR